MTVDAAERERVERELKERAARLTALAQHPLWAELRHVFDAKKERHLRVLVAKLMSGAPVDQRHIDFTRGFWAGANWLLSNPEQAEASLERALHANKARTRVEEHGSA